MNVNVLQLLFYSLNDEYVEEKEKMKRDKREERYGNSKKQ